MVFRLEYYENGQVKRVENFKTGNLLMENVLKKMDWK
jgi:antitoxin component YwqK of YwqJK toxin-antitoxin module